MQMKIRKSRWVFRIMFGIALIAGSAMANNLCITNLSVSGRDGTTAFVRFDISWDNSWRYSSGGDPLYFHDAVWVFFKARIDGANQEWKHVKLHGTGINPTGFDAGSGTGIEMVVPEDRAGMFIRRAQDGTSPVQVAQLTALWNFSASGLGQGNVRLQAMGIEMCYVAEGAFKVGDGGASSIQGQFEKSQSGQPFAIISASQEIILGGSDTDSLCNHNNSGMNPADDFSYATSKQLPAAYPNGYAAFYCMKYLVTQGQYADFLNTLTREQQPARCSATIVGRYMSDAAGGSVGIANRNTVKLVEDPGGFQPRRYATVTPDRACNYISWADLAAFADWSGLRPMTELEYEKACRGPLEPKPNEYACGMASYEAISGLKGVDGSGEEYYTTGNMICNASSPGGPARVGIFARAGATREQSGASYWGVMEFSGNLWERSVSLGNATGRAFTGLHGDGNLTSAGDANVEFWPGAGGVGAGLRGGGWGSATPVLRVSDRYYASYTFADRFHYYGGRVVRTAPGETP